ncbi:MAG: mechanosensitive ion channel family protein [Alphaproteobacteria bacterium]|nr:mechanosensitive ion channel family protein [Alphaproteobacteria bacterium]
MDILEGFWQQVALVWKAGVFGVSLGPILAAVLVFFLFSVTRGFFTRVILKAMRRLADRTSTRIDNMFVDALEKPVQFAFLVLGLYVAVQVVSGSVDTGDWVHSLIRVLIIFTIFWALFLMVEPFSYLIDRVLAQLGTPLTAQETLHAFAVKILKVLIVILGIAAVLQEWGFNVAAVLGGLGLAGMAFALGAKDMIANLFGGTMIFMNKLFDRGDWIQTSHLEGVVEEIGLIASRVRQFDKALVTVPNSLLTNEPIINYSKMTNRRIYWKVGVEYRTTQDQLRTIVHQIRDHIHDTDAFETDPERVSTLVFVDEFADSSINIMIYCFTKTTNWAEWLDVKQDFAFKIKTIVEGAGSGFAFPSQSVYVEKWPMGEAEPFPLQADAEGTASG